MGYAMNAPCVDENENDYNAWEDEWAGNPQILTPVHLKVSVDASGKRLDAALAILLPDYSRSRLQKWLSDGAVVLNGEVQTAGRVKVYEHDDLIVTPQPSDEMKAYTAEPMDLDIVYQDNDILVLNKPAGLVVHPGSGNWSGTLLNGLLHAYPHIGQVPRAGIVHRLDKDTSGLMVVAKTVMAQTDLVRQLQARTVKRRYIALVQGEIDSDGVIDIGIGRSPQDRLKMAALIGNSGKAARTFYQSMGFWRFQDKPYSIVVCQLESGRTHQIRVHMQHRGYPLVGDQLYGEKKGTRSSIVAGVSTFSRQALHAYQLGLIHPRTGDFMSWQQDLPEDYVQLLAEMGVEDFPLPESDMPMDALENLSE
jgi:23S rRNA pseudouridine1911/1915/1917 synthase